MACKSAFASSCASNGLLGRRWELRARGPGHHNPSWLTPGGAKLGKDDPPAAWSPCTRSCVASSPHGKCSGASQPLLPLLEGTGQISPFPECFKLEEGTDGGTAWSTEAIPPGPSQAPSPALGACRDEWEDSFTLKSWAVPLTAHSPQAIRAAMVPVCRLHPVPALGRIYTSSSSLRVRKPHAF